MSQIMQESNHDLEKIAFSSNSQQVDSLSYNNSYMRTYMEDSFEKFSCKNNKNASIFKLKNNEQNTDKT